MVINYLIEDLGKILVFAAGNGSKDEREYYENIPAAFANIISVGGAYIENIIYENPGLLEWAYCLNINNSNILASNMAKGYESKIVTPGNPGRIVPDVVGLVGMSGNYYANNRSRLKLAEPKDGMYLLLPTHPSSANDVNFATPKNKNSENKYKNGDISIDPGFPYSDMTEPDDGWLCFSGTSSATAQAAGVCALLKQYVNILKKEFSDEMALFTLDQQMCKEILMAGARDVACGKSFDGYKAKAKQSDCATGYGLVDAEGSLLVMTIIFIILYIGYHENINDPE